MALATCLEHLHAGPARRQARHRVCRLDLPIDSQSSLISVLRDCQARISADRNATYIGPSHSPTNPLPAWRSNILLISARVLYPCYSQPAAEAPRATFTLRRTAPESSIFVSPMGVTRAGQRSQSILYFRFVACACRQFDNDCRLCSRATTIPHMPRCTGMRD